MNVKTRCLFLFFLVVYCCSCSVSKYIPKGRYLVTKNTVYISYNDTIPKKERVKKKQPLDYIPLSQTPNKRVAGINAGLWFYFKAKPDKNNWWNNVLRKIGQPPVYFDSLENVKSLENMRIFMTSKGYLDAKVTDTVRYKKDRAYIDYYITPGAPYRIDSVWYNYVDTGLRRVLSDELHYRGSIKKGNLLTREVLEGERQRIAALLHGKGYYTFNVNDVNFLIDTFRRSHLSLVQVNVEKNKTSFATTSHKPYLVESLKVFPNYKTGLNAQTPFDTVTISGVGYYYQNAKINIRPKLISKQVDIAPDSLWSPNNTNRTIDNLLNFKYYRNVEVDYLIEDDSVSLSQKDPRYGYLKGYVRMSPAKLQSYKVEAELSSSANFTSLVLKIGYGNKNLFRGSEQFNIDFNVGYDFMYQKKDQAVRPSDAYEFGISTSLAFPKLLVPFRLSKKRTAYSADSKIALSFDFQNRPYYRRNLGNISFGYRWSTRKGLSYYYNPASISYIALPRIDPSFLDSITNPYLRNTYTNQLIPGSNFGIEYRRERPIGGNMKIIATAESAGNLFYLGEMIFNAKKYTNEDGEKYYKFFGQRFAQYMRADFNIAYNYKFDAKNSIVGRFFAGAGFGYGNSMSMPFERLFFAGGNSSMRGWQIRGLGPGNKYIDPEIKYPNALGDIRLEANLEGRFALLGPLRGAVFFDLGNVWSNGKGETDPNAVFKFNRFYKQLGFNTGIGLRFDLNFFVLRLDWGIILHNPSALEGQRWIQDFSLKNTALHFAVGYPF